MFSKHVYRRSQHDDDVDDNESDDGGDHNDNPFFLSVIERFMNIQLRLSIHHML